MIRKRYILFISLILIIIVLVLVFDKNNPEILEENKVCLNNKCFVVEVADTLEKRTKGLMDRESLAQDKGMLFIFDKEEEYSFWMKNTLIPLDIIWINKDKQVVDIEKNVQPCQTDPCLRYSPDQKAKYVLELNAGQSDQAQIKIGDKLTLTF
jgi:uncharacterized membrane protein (UPF0127 family)